MEFLKDVIEPFLRTNLSFEWIDGFAPETLLTQKKEKVPCDIWGRPCLDISIILEAEWQVLEWLSQQTSG